MSSSQTSFSQYPDQPKSRAWIVGLAKNCSRTLDGNILSLENFCREFLVSWIIVESESEDSTRDILDLHQSTKADFTVLSPGAASYLEPVYRAQKMATLRNLYLDEIQSRGVQGSDILVVVDFDNSLKLQSRLSHFASFPDGKKAIFASSQGPYYDVWALRDSDHGFDYHKEILARIAKGVNPFKAYMECLVGPQIRLRSLQKLHAVESAFGGLAVYPAKEATGFRYSDNRGCEHVEFNLKLGEVLTGMYIHPKLRIPRVSEHTRLASLMGICILVIGSLLPSRAANKAFRLWQRIQA